MLNRLQDVFKSFPQRRVVRRSADMIDRESRDRLARALRHYVSGQITNDDLDGVEVDWRDRGASAVKDMAWNLYSDGHTHYVENRIPRGSEVRRTIAQWIVFLYTDEEYLWPEYSFTQIVNWPMNILTFGWWEKAKSRKWNQFLRAGDFDVWPFCRRADCERASKRPRFLAGSARLWGSSVRSGAGG